MVTEAGESVKVENWDVLVVGGGAAGCRAALEAAKHTPSVTLVDKGVFGHSGMSGALPEWRVSAPMSLCDNPEKYFADHIKGSEFLANWRLIKILAEEANDRLLELEAYGNIFTRESGGEPVVTQPGGHSVPRTYTPAYLYVMANEVRRMKVNVVEETMVTDLLTEGGRVAGALALNKRTGKFIAIQAKSTIIATGGAGQVYATPARVWQSTTPMETTGDGYAMAYRVGAELVDMEFVQFVLETLYGTEAGLSGDTVMGAALSRACASRSQSTLDSNPACHHFMGGMVIDERCRTTVPFLYAAGEVAGGIHSSRRLESSALASCLVFGKRAGEFAAREALETEKLELDLSKVEACVERALAPMKSEPPEGVRPHEVRSRLSRLMWSTAGEYKDKKGLETAIRELKRIRAQLAKMYLSSKTRVFNAEWIEALENYNLILTAEMHVRAAYTREESRGGFKRRDYPSKDDKNYLVNIYLRQVDGKMELYKRPVVELR